VLRMPTLACVLRRMNSQKTNRKILQIMQLNIEVKEHFWQGYTSWSTVHHLVHHVIHHPL